MNFKERAVTFPCAEESLLGIVAIPEQPKATAVLIIVGGPQYRVGSHRQFLLLSRALAGEGYPVLRFDYRGMGDSSGTQRDFLSISDDIAASIRTLLRACPGVRKVVLWGLCDAASAALIYWQQTRDPLVSGLCLLNPWVRSEATLARTRVKHYYGQRLLQREFWSKVLSGKLALGRSLSSLMRNLILSMTVPGQPKSETLTFQEVMAQACNQFDGAILLILSGDDHTAKEFLEYAATSAPLSAALRQSSLERRDMAEADHTFSNALWRRQVEETTVDWLKTLPGPA